MSSIRTCCSKLECPRSFRSLSSQNSHGNNWEQFVRWNLILNKRVLPHKWKFKHWGTHVHGQYNSYIFNTQDTFLPELLIMQCVHLVRCIFNDPCFWPMSHRSPGPAYLYLAALAVFRRSVCTREVCIGIIIRLYISNCTLYWDVLDSVPNESIMKAKFSWHNWSFQRVLKTRWIY